MDLLPAYPNLAETAGSASMHAQTTGSTDAPEQLGVQLASEQAVTEQPDRLAANSPAEPEGMAAPGRQPDGPSTETTHRRTGVIERLVGSLAMPATAFGLGVMLVGASAAMARGTSRGSGGSEGSGDSKAKTDAAVQKILQQAADRQMTEAAAKVREAVQLYGENSPEALKATLEYGSTENFWKPPTE